QYPNKALVMSEFGAEATYDGPENVKETYAFQSNYIRKTLRVVKNESFLSGAIYWTLQEFAVKPEWDGGAKRAGVPRDSIHNKGLIAYRGRPKPAWRVASRQFAATPLFPGAPRAAARRLPPGAPSDVPGAVLLALALAGLLGAGTFNVWCFRAIRAARPEPAPVVPLWREADRDDVAVGHDVVAAFEA
ncbi:MAG TPA: hypothetical protein VGJ70_25315, partial [Solirubrobacteraceae bacterium]